MVGHLTSDRGIAVLLSLFTVLTALTFAAGGYALHEAQRAVDGIQASRHEQCVQQNARHDQTVQALDTQIAELPASEHARALARRAGTIALIDALSPRRDCDRVFPKR